MADLTSTNPEVEKKIDENIELDQNIQKAINDPFAGGARGAK